MLRFSYASLNIKNKRSSQFLHVLKHRGILAKKKIMKDFDAILTNLNKYATKNKRPEYKTFDESQKDALSGVAVIPTGIDDLDKALGTGGFVKGVMIELFGPESSGKSWVAYKAIATCQKNGGVAALIDAEQSADKPWLEGIGVDTSKLIFENGAVSMETHLQRVFDMCGHVDLIVIDSTAALVPKSELEGNVGDIGVAAQARVLSQAIRKLTQAIKGGLSGSKGRTTIIWINQLRDKVGMVWGNPETTPGGKALKFYSHVRIDVRKIGFEKVKVNDDDVIVSQNSKGTVVKNKTGVPYQKFLFNIPFKSSFSNSLVLLAQAAIKAKIFYKTKGEYRFKSLEDEKIPTETSDFVTLANWIYDKELVPEIVERVTESLNENEEEVPDYLNTIDDETKPPSIVKEDDSLTGGEE